MSLLNALGSMAGGLIASRASKYVNPMFENLFSQDPAPIEDRSTQAIPAQMQGGATVGLDPYASMPPVQGYDMPPMQLGAMEMNLPALGAPEDDIGILAAQYDLNPEYVESAMAEGMTIPDLREAAQLSDAMYDGQKRLATIKLKKAQGEDTSEDESTLSKIGGGLKNFFGSEKGMLSMALAFNTLRNKPDNQLAAGIQDRLKTINENQTTAANVPEIISYLQNKGYTELANIVANDPKQAKDVLKQVMQKELSKQASPTVSTPRIDEETGEEYILITNPQTGKVEKVMTGGRGETAAGKREEETRIKREEASGIVGRNSSTAILNIADNLATQLAAYDDIEKSLLEGAYTGIGSFIPTFRDSTIRLENAVNRLGLGVIGGTTFGALSESELNFALSTAFPTNLSREEALKFVRDKKAAQARVRQELISEAAKMNRMGYDAYLEDLRKLNEQVAANRAKDGQTNQSAKPVNENLTPVQKAMIKRGLL